MWAARLSEADYVPEVIMRKISQYTLLVLLSAMVFSGSGLCQNFSEDLLRSKVDAVILEAYQSVSSAFPCKLKAGGKPKMLSWEGGRFDAAPPQNGEDWVTLAGGWSSCSSKP